ncbi:MAG: type 2 isopentenyl-diphosphate Delta-isomerase [Chloroflexi bacterium]|nr:type 2 isopentenyl-diphosphate Delta-isomerase [Chloroflexota bacterium]
MQQTHSPGQSYGGSGLEGRKQDHIRIALEEEVEPRGVTTGLENYDFIHQALPELDLGQIDPSTTLLGKRLAAPLLVSSMTGGVELARTINHNLAEAAQSLGLGMGVGSMRAALENPQVASTFQVREVAADILLFANLGAVQLNYGYGVEECRRAVELISADALILHLNPLQEAVQPGGNTNFSGLVKKIEEVCRALEVPVVVKEVGWGISQEVAKELAAAGVAAIDVAGAGGTSWSEVEKHRAATEKDRNIASAFVGWGIPTADSLLMARKGAPNTPLIASGGMRDGIEVAKTIALGASAAALASPFLRPATESAEAVVEKMKEIVQELRIAMFAIRAPNLQALRDTPFLRRKD